MSDSVNSFVFYRSFREAIRPLGEKEQLKVLLAICDYALYGEEPALTGVPLALFTVVKPNLDANNKRRKSGSCGGRPKKEAVVSETENRRLSAPETGGYANGKPNEDEEVDVDEDTDGDRDGERKGAGKPPSPTPKFNARFVPPTLEEVTAYVRERGSNVDPQGFLDFYASKGWLVGKAPMKDWKAACRNAERWERWEKKTGVRTASDYENGDDFFTR